LLAKEQQPWRLKVRAARLQQPGGLHAASLRWGNG
jgi:hypothetical protein